MNPMEDASTVEQMIMNRAKAAGTPINGSIELTPLCNMNCEMCYVRMSREEMERQGRLRTAEEWLEVGRQMQKAGVLFLLLTGGEPLLYPGFKEVYLGLKKLGMILTINTNATLLDEEWADFFARHKPRRINITLYGPDEETYHNLCHYKEGYSRTMRAVELLRERGVDVKLASSATKANGGQMDRIHACGEKLNVPLHVDTYMMPATREHGMPYALQSRLDPVQAAEVRIACLKREMGEDMFRQYVEQSLDMVEHFVPSDTGDRMNCYAGSCSFTVNWQGNMRPCVVLAEPSVSVFEQGFEAAWQQIREHCQAVRLNPKCKACRLRPLCRTCAASALLETGSYDGVPDYMCRYAEESYRLIRLEGERMGHE